MYRGDRFTVNTNIKSLCATPETVSCCVISQSLKGSPPNGMYHGLSIPTCIRI